ncbi:hypothetical protein EDD22DRAFT_243650 [Suillus occidentalis]|nr:hypothetical protein EDD22DRAFT_243650 [Suillus occidentalis]
MHLSLVFTFLLAFGFCAAQNFTLPQCAQLCAGTAATAAGCDSYSNATCVCASQPFQSAIQSCFNTSCNTTTQGTAWAYYSNLCTDGSSASSGASSSTFSGSSTTTTVSTTTSTATGPVTSHTSTQTSSSLSSVASVSSTTTSAGQTTTSTSGAIATDINMIRGIMAIIVGGALIL